MNAILALSLVGASSCIFLGVLFLTRKRFISNIFLGLFFLLIAIKLGKLVIQTYTTGVVLNGYFNLVHAAFLAIGPVVWLYIRTYLSRPFFWKQLIHFLPALFFLLGAFHSRQFVGEPFWLAIYWLTLFHPLLYVGFSIRFLMQTIPSTNLSGIQIKWLYGLLGVVSFIIGINILYFCSNFPFYIVTALLLLASLYLITFLLFYNKSNIIFGEISPKYKNLNWQPKEINKLYKKIKRLLEEEQWYLKDKIKLSDVATELNTPSHIISMVINAAGQMNFREYVNQLRIENAKKKLMEEADRKIIAIALESGFSSLSTFNRVFKKFTNTSPTQYRAKHVRK